MDSFAKYAGLGFQLVTPLLLGIVLGLWVDSKLNTPPLFFIFFLFIGVVLSFYILIKTTERTK